MAVFMKVDGATGSATANGYNGWTMVHGVNWGAERHIGSSQGTNACFEQGALYLSEVALAFTYDQVTHSVFSALCKGKVIPKVEFHFCCAGKSLDPFMKLELEDVVIGSHLTQAPHGGLPLEQMTLHCRQLTRLSTFADANNVKKQVAVGYDAMRQVSL